MCQAAQKELADFTATSAAALFESHTAAWHANWEAGVEAEGNVTVSSALNSSLYYIYSVSGLQVWQV
jgi:hypothetical protein